MASMREIKRRKSSVQSTQQITKAMKLISTVKLQKARMRAENSKAYFECMYSTVTSMLAKAGNIEHPYLKAGESKKVGIVVVTSNRGLAGGYNSNVVKLITESGIAKEDVRLYLVGKKGGREPCRKGYEVALDCSDMIEEPTYADAQALSKRLLTDFANGEIGEIYVAYTFFKNTVTHIPTFKKLLPVDTSDATEENRVRKQQRADEL